MVSRLNPGPFVKSRWRFENGFALDSLKGFRSSSLRVSVIVSWIAIETNTRREQKCSVAGRPTSRETPTPMKGPEIPARSIQKPSADLMRAESSGRVPKRSECAAEKTGHVPAWMMPQGMASKSALVRMR